MSDFDMMESEHPTVRHMSLVTSMGVDLDSYGQKPEFVTLEEENVFEPHQASMMLNEDESQFVNPQHFTEYDEDKAAGEEEVEVYCICKKAAEGFMIGCENCNEWYHGRCVGIDADMGSRLEQYICHTCNNATVKENLELLTASIISSKRSSRRRGDYFIHDPNMQVSEDTTDKEPSKQAPPSIAIKKSAAVSNSSKVTKKDPTKKRTHENSELEATHAKKPKIREYGAPAASSIPVRKIRPHTSPSHGLGPITSEDRHRLSFRNSILDVLEMISEDPEFSKTKAKEMSTMKKNTQNDKDSGIGEVSKDQTKKDSTVLPSRDAAPITSENESDLKKLSEEIEREWFDKCGRRSDDTHYTEELRSLRFSLKNNPSLVARLILNLLTPRKLACMTPEEMAPSTAREALASLRAQDELYRNKIAETEGEKQTEKELFRLRGRIDERNLPSAPVFAPPPADDDATTDDILIDNILHSSSNLRTSNTLLPGAQTAEGDKMVNEAEPIHSESELASSTDPSILFKQKALVLPAPRVELDLDAFNMPQITSRLETSEEPTVGAAPITSYPPSNFGASSKPTTSEPDVQLGIRSILDEIAMDSGAIPQHSDKPQSPTSSKSKKSSPRQHPKPEVESTHSQSHTGFRILDPEDEDHRKVTSPTPNIWSGKISYEDVLPTVSVTLTAVSGFRVDRVLQRLNLASFEIGRIVDIDKILAYLPQLDTSSSRLKSLLYFEPSSTDSNARKTYQEFFDHLHSISRTGVVAIKGAIAGEGVIREVYILPVKAGDKSHPSVFPESVLSETTDRLYLSLVSDKKAWEKMNAGLGRYDAVSTPLLAPNPLLASSVPSDTPSIAKTSSPLLGTSLGGSSSVYTQPPPMLGGNYLGGGSLGTSSINAPLLGASRSPLPSQPSPAVPALGGRYNPPPNAGPPSYPGAAPPGYPMPPYPQNPSTAPSYPSHTIPTPGNPKTGHPNFPYQNHHSYPQNGHRGGYQNQSHGAPPPHQYQPPYYPQQQQPTNYTPQFGAHPKFPPHFQPPSQHHQAPRQPYQPPNQAGYQPPYNQQPQQPQQQPQQPIPPKPQSTASSAAISFLDSLKGVDLDNLLGPPK